MQRAKINMYPNEDKDGAIYYIGRLKSPITINFKDGVAFILYTDSDDPELHFCPLEVPDISDVFEYYETRRPNPNRARHQNLSIDLHARYEKDPLPGEQARKFYIGRIQFDGLVNCSDGVIFLAFTSDPNQEQLQIAVVDPNKAYVKKFNRA